MMVRVEQREELGIDAFIARAVDHYLLQLDTTSDTAERRIIEDAIALLTDYRLSDIDEGAFDALLTRMIAGRSPVAMVASDAPTVGMELRGHWQAYRRSLAAPS